METATRNEIEAQESEGGGKGEWRGGGGARNSLVIRRFADLRSQMAKKGLWDRRFE